jgi:hypothetical protein
MITRYVFETEEDWIGKRNWVFTASEVNRLMAEPSKKAKEAGQILSDGAISYIIEKISAYYGNPKFIFKNLEMEWGTNTEPEAALTLCELLELNPASNEVIYTSHNGTVFFSDEILGGTPDMIFPNLKAIAEIKCPNSQNHLYNKLYLTPDNFQSEYPVYYDQMQTNMYLCDADKCFFLSYDPRFKDVNVSIHLIEIERNQERINAIIDKSKLAFELKNQLLNKLKLN